MAQSRAVGSVVVSTALDGPYDQIVPQPTVPGVDYVCFTDQPVRAAPWEVIGVKP